MKKEMTKEERAYIAGFFDGDGTVFTYKYKATKNGKKYTRLNAVFINTNRKVLEWIQSFFDVGTIHIHKGTKIGKTRKTCYKLRYQDKTARIVLKLILPYLIIKKDKAKKLLGM